VVSKLVPALALILLAGPVCALAADSTSSAPASDAKTSTHAKKHHTSKKKKAATSSAPESK
jgi:hypothetical protein